MSDETPRPEKDELALWRANLVAMLEARRRSLATEPRRQEGRTEATTGECLSLLAIFLVMVGGGVLLACNFAIAVWASGFPHLPASLALSGCGVTVCVASVGLGVLEMRRWYRVWRRQSERSV